MIQYDMYLCIIQFISTSVHPYEIKLFAHDTILITYHTILLCSYFYVIGISYDKMHFTCIWINLSRFKIITTSDYIEDMKITQELLKKS